MPAISSSLQANVNATIVGSTTPAIANVVCTLANTEYSQALPSGTKGYMISPRGGSLKLAYTVATSGTIYITVPANSFKAVGNLSLTSIVSLYFQSPTAGAVAEIEYWS